MNINTYIADSFGRHTLYSTYRVVLSHYHVLRTRYVLETEFLYVHMHYFNKSFKTETQDSFYVQIIDLLCSNYRL